MKSINTLLIAILTILLSSYTILAGNFFLKTGQTDPTVVSHWSSTLDGSGASPANFTTAGQVFNVVNNATVTQAGTWTVSGAGSKVIVGDGSTAVTYNNNAALTTPAIDVTNNAILKLSVSTIPTLGTLSTGSTVNYCSAGGQSVTATTYSNLTTSVGGKSLAGTAIVNGTLTLSSSFTVGAGATLTITNNIAGTGSFLVTGGSSSIISNGTSSLTLPSSVTNIKNLTINNSGGCTLNSNLAIAGALTLQLGSFSVGANTLTFNASSSLSITAGTLTTTSSSNLRLLTNITIPSSVAALNDLFLQVSPSTNTLSSALVVSGTLTLNTGNLANGAFLTMGTGSTINRNVGTIASEPSATTTYNLIYSMASAGTTTTGPELPATTTKLNNLTVAGGSSRQITLNKNVTVNGNINITTGLLSFSTFTVSLVGNFVNSQASANFISSTSTINFTGGSCSITTTDENEFNNITITGTLSAPTAFNLRLKGNFANNGTFTHNSGTVKFSSNSTISGSSTTTFYNVNIITGATLVGKSNGNINVANNFNNDGTTYTHNNGTVTFTGGACTVTGATTTTFKNVTISGTLIGPTTLTLAGNFTNNGSFTQGTGTVAFTSAGNKDIAGTTTTTFNDITVSAGTLRVEVSANLTGTITPSGTAIFDADGTSGTSIFKLISDGSGTARIGTVATGASVTGNIKMQRMVTGTSPHWVLISTPIKSKTLADWQTSFPTSGYTGATGSAGSFVSVYTDDETAATSMSDANRYVVPSSSGDAISVGKGYWVYIGSTGGTSGNVTVNLSGNPQVNRQTADAVLNFGVTYTGGTDPGWNLIANPFPSEIDWDAASGWTKTNMANAIYYYDVTAAGDQFSGYVNGVSEDGIVSNIIPSSQGVFVQATSASPVLTCDERVKPAAHSTPNFLKTTTSTKPLVRLKLLQGTRSTSTVVYFEQGATLGYDPSKDAQNFTDTVSNNNFDVSTVNGAIRFSISAIPLFTNNISIPVRTLVGTTGTFTLKATSIDNMDQSICITLFDALTSTYTNLRTDSVVVTINDTIRQPRFFLNFDNTNQVTFAKNITQPTCTDASNMTVITPSGTGPFNIIWRDANHNVIRNILNINSADTLHDLPSGNYTVEVYNGAACGYATDVFSINDVTPNVATFSTQTPNCNGAHNAQITATPAGNGPYHYVWYDSNLNVIREQIGLTTLDALTNIGAGDYSVNVSFNSGCVVSQLFTITEPALPSASFVNVDSVNINNADSILFVNTSTDATNYVWVVSGTAGTFTDNDLYHSFTAEGTYTVTLTASDNNCNGTSVTSNTVVVYAPVVTAVNNTVASVNKDEDIKLLGTLEGTKLLFNYTSDKPVFISVYNALGQQLTQRLSVTPNNQIINLDIENASNQILFINISGAEKNQTFRIFNK